jgi:hypothetical protein
MNIRDFREGSHLHWDAKSIIVAFSLIAEALALVLFTLSHFVAS